MSKWIKISKAPGATADTYPYRVKWGEGAVQHDYIPAPNEEEARAYAAGLRAGYRWAVQALGSTPSIQSQTEED